MRTIDVEIVGYDLTTGSRLAKEVDEILRGSRRYGYSDWK
jgi:hypothetical protein